MDRLITLVNEKGYLRKQQEGILRLFENINDNIKEQTICVFMDFIESTDCYFGALSKCTGYVYELYGGTKARGEILRIFHEREYDVLETNKILHLFADVPFSEKENLAKEILPIVVKIQDLNLIIKKAKQIAHDFKKEKLILKGEKLL